MTTEKGTDRDGVIVIPFTDNHCVYDRLNRSNLGSQKDTAKLRANLTDLKDAYGLLICQAANCSVTCVVSDEGAYMRPVEDPINVIQACARRIPLK